MSKVSIIISTFNRPQWLLQAIKSALNQTYSSVETIVIDDGSSSDEAQRIVSQFSKIRYIYQANQGPGRARNAGLVASQGEFIQFLDDDDWLTPDSITKKIQFFDSISKCGSVYSDLFLTNEHGKVIGTYYSSYQRPLPIGDIFHKLVSQNFIPDHAILWKRDLLEKVGGFPDTYGHEDWECLIKAAEISNFYYIDKPLGYYRLHHTGLTSNFQQMMNGKNHLNLYVASSDRFLTLPDKQQAALLRKYALQQWSYGDQALAKTYLCRALKIKSCNFPNIVIKALFLSGKIPAKLLLHGNWLYTYLRTRSL